MALLAVERLSLTLNGVKKINEISFSLQPGERLALLGASGSGKSLIARTLLGLPLPGAQLTGSVRLNHVEILPSPLHARRPQQRIATIFQDSAIALNPLIPVGKQLAMALSAAGTRRRSARHIIAAQLLNTVGFADPNTILLRYPGELSGGQRQRVCIALAFACNSPLLIADEPTTALDVVTQAQVLRALSAYTAGATPRALLFITHDIAVAAALCQRAIVIAQGDIIEQGPIASLLAAPHHPYTQRLVAAARQQSPYGAHSSSPAYSEAV